MAEGLLFGVVERILWKLGSSALREIGLWWGVNDETELLRATADGIKRVLPDAESRQARRDDPLEPWLGMLKEVLCDADDMLDDFSTEVLRRQVMTGNKVAKKVRLFFSSSNQLTYGLKMGHKIKAIRERLDAVMRVGMHFNFQQRHVDTSTSVMAKEREQTHSSVPEVVVGREVEKNAITQLLSSENYETNVAVVSIVGIGGLGKTTLAQLAYNDEDVKSQFELRMWVCVSNDFNVKQIVKNILESVTGEIPNISQMDPLKDLLCKKINGKKYLLVLDDIWNDNAKEWDSLKDLLIGGSRGSRILVTTRSKKVAKITSLPQSRYELTGLSNEKSWSLFAQVAFEQGCAPPSFEEIGQEIVAKCKGVPLSIRVIGRLLYLKETIAEWELFKSKELTEMDQGESRIMATLKLSYDHLPSHLKHCFAYCRLFPKDYEIDVDELVDLWIAQGYIKLSSDQSLCLEDVGRECYMDLLWRSFFQDVEKDEYGNVMSCKMHDLIHDLACSVAGAESAYVSISNPIEVGEKTRHISFDPPIFRDSDTWQVPVSVLEAKSLRTFFAPGSDYPPRGKIGEGQCHAIFCNLRRLRQLDLKGLGIETVPHSIGKSKQLRYLDLSGNGEIEMLPRTITRLQNLQVLKLRDCYGLRQLPKDIKKLVSLKKLDIDGCFSLTHMPRGIGQLTSLERLTRFVLPGSKKEESKSGGLGELRDLNKLGGVLNIENLSHHGNGTGNANLREMPRLQELLLEWVDLDGNDDIDINEDEMSLEALRPHPYLKRLTVKNYRGMKFASWLSSLTNLVRLELYDCWKCRSLPALDQIPSLKEIYIYRLTDLEYIDIRSSCAVGGGGSAFFPSLETMRLYNCPNLKGWRPSSPSSSSSLLPQFQCLSWLSIESCPNLTSMPAFPPSFNKLTIRSGSFKSLEQVLKGTISPAHEPSSSSLSSILSSSSLQHLWIDGIEHLPEDFLLVELLQTLTSLEELRIWNCPTLTCLPHARMLLLTSLRSLEIRDCENLDPSKDDDDSNSNNNDAILWQGQGLRSLTSLEIWGIPKLVHLPRWLLLHSVVLQHLLIYSCPNLASLPEWMPNLTSLQKLAISNCENLDLSNYDDDSNSNNNDAILWQGQGLRSLTSLAIGGIPKLVHLPKRLLLHSIVLRSLSIWNCPNLASLPEWMPNLTSLQHLGINSCSQLSERCQSNMGEDWPKIAHIPNIWVQERYIQWDGCYQL